MIHALWCAIHRIFVGGECPHMQAQPALDLKKIFEGAANGGRYDQETVREQIRLLNDQLAILDREARLIRGEKV